MTTAGKAGATNAAEDVRKQLKDDPQLFALHKLFTRSDFISAATSHKVVWGHVKGYPWWPAQVMSIKEAKARFKKLGQHHNEKKEQTCTPVIFFETMEISWLPAKQVNDWAAGLKANAHIKQRGQSKFRAGLLQICDFFCRGKAPNGWVAKAPQPVTAVPSDVDEPSSEDTGEDSDGQDTDPKSDDDADSGDADASASPERPAPLRAKGRAAAAKAATAATERQTSELERSKQAILGGMSRDQRHKRRQEATLATPSDAEPSSAAPSQGRKPPALRRGRSATAQPVESASGAPQSDAAEAAAPAVADSVATGDADASQLLGKRHTRSKGHAELDASDLANLSCGGSMRPVAKRAASSAAQTGPQPSTSKAQPEATSLRDTADAAPAEPQATNGAQASPANADGDVDMAIEPAGTSEGAAGGEVHSAQAADTPAAATTDAAPDIAVDTARESAALDGAHKGSAPEKPNGVVQARADTEPAQLASAAPAASTATRAVAASLTHASAGAASTAPVKADASSADADGQAEPEPEPDAEAEAGSGDDAAAHADVAAMRRDESQATDAGDGTATGSEPPAAAGARRSRRDAPGRKSALELVQGKAKGAEERKRRATASRPPSANRGQGRRNNKRTYNPALTAQYASAASGALDVLAGAAEMDAQEAPANGAAAAQAVVGGTRYVNELRRQCYEQYYLLKRRAERQRLSKVEELLAERYIEGCQVKLDAHAREVQSQIDKLLAASQIAPHGAQLQPVAAAQASAPVSLGSILARALPQPSMTEFALPSEYILMREVPYEQVLVNKYPPAHRPKKSKSDIMYCYAGCWAALARHVDERTKGKGLVAREEIAASAFVVEYTGEIITEQERLERMASAQRRGAVHFYIMQLTKDLYIDAEHMGSNARFMNSSCEPNCETQKWKDAATGETRIGIFTTRRVFPGEELTYDYHFQHSGLQTAAQGFRCMCGAARCRGTMDVNPERIKDIGRRIKVCWEDDKWYEGRVLSYAPVTGKHTIFYPGASDKPLEGTKESILLPEVAHEWLDEPFPTVDEAARRPAAPINSIVGTDANSLRAPGEAAAQACAARLCDAWPGDPAATPAAAHIAEVAHVHAAALLPANGEPSAVREPLPAPLPLAPNDAYFSSLDPMAQLAASAATSTSRASERRWFSLPMFRCLARFPPPLPSAYTLEDALPWAAANGELRTSDSEAQSSLAAGGAVPQAAAAAAAQPAAAAPQPGEARANGSVVAPPGVSLAQVMPALMPALGGNMPSQEQLAQLQALPAEFQQQLLLHLFAQQQAAQAQQAAQHQQQQQEQQAQQAQHAQQQQAALLQQAMQQQSQQQLAQLLTAAAAQHAHLQQQYQQQHMHVGMNAFLPQQTVDAQSAEAAHQMLARMHGACAPHSAQLQQQTQHQQQQQDASQHQHLPQQHQQQAAQPQHPASQQMPQQMQQGLFEQQLRAQLENAQPHASQADQHQQPTPPQTQHEANVGSLAMHKQASVVPNGQLAAAAPALPSPESLAADAAAVASHMEPIQRRTSSNSTQAAAHHANGMSSAPALAHASGTSFLGHIMPGSHMLGSANAAACAGQHAGKESAPVASPVHAPAQTLTPAPQTPNPHAGLGNERALAGFAAGMPPAWEGAGAQALTAPGAEGVLQRGW